VIVVTQHTIYCRIVNICRSTQLADITCGFGVKYFNVFFTKAIYIANVCSGAETNLKVGGHTKFLSCPSTFLALRVQLVVLVIVFLMVSTVWQVYCLLFYTHGAPVPWRRRRCMAQCLMRIDLQTAWIKLVIKSCIVGLATANFLYDWNFSKHAQITLNYLAYYTF